MSSLIKKLFSWGQSKDDPNILNTSISGPPLFSGYFIPESKILQQNSQNNMRVYVDECIQVGEPYFRRVNQSQEWSPQNNNQEKGTEANNLANSSTSTSSVGYRLYETYQRITKEEQEKSQNSQSSKKDGHSGVSGSNDSSSKPSGSLQIKPKGISLAGPKLGAKSDDGKPKLGLSLSLGKKDDNKSEEKKDEATSDEKKETDTEKKEEPAKKGLSLSLGGKPGLSLKSKPDEKKDGEEVPAKPSLKLTIPKIGEKKEESSEKKEENAEKKDETSDKKENKPETKPKLGLNLSLPKLGQKKDETTEKKDESSDKKEDKPGEKPKLGLNLSIPKIGQKKEETTDKKEEFADNKNDKPETKPKLGLNLSIPKLGQKKEENNDKKEESTEKKDEKSETKPKLGFNLSMPKLGQKKDETAEKKDESSDKKEEKQEEKPKPGFNLSLPKLGQKKEETTENKDEKPKPGLNLKFRLNKGENSSEKPKLGLNLSIPKVGQKKEEEKPNNLQVSTPKPEQNKEEPNEEEKPKLGGLKLSTPKKEETTAGEPQKPSSGLNLSLPKSNGDSKSLNLPKWDLKGKGLANALNKVQSPTVTLNKDEGEKPKQGLSLNLGLQKSGATTQLSKIADQPEEEKKEATQPVQNKPASGISLGLKTGGLKLPQPPKLAPATNAAKTEEAPKTDQKAAETKTEGDEWDQLNKATAKTAETKSQSSIALPAKTGSGWGQVSNGSQWSSGVNASKWDDKPSAATTSWVSNQKSSGNAGWRSTNTSSSTQQSWGTVQRATNWKASNGRNHADRKISKGWDNMDKTNRNYFSKI